MNTSSRNIPDQVTAAPADDGVSGAADCGPVPDSLSVDDLARMQHEKIESIRKAIAAGAYDSEEMLEKALTRMLERMESDDDAS